MAALKFVQSPVAALALPIGSADTTIYGLNIKDIYGNYLSMTNFGDIGYMTINPTSPFAEIVSFTGCVYQGNGTTKFTGCTRGLLAIDPYTTGGTANAHQANDSIVFSINPQTLNTFVQKGQDATITGAFTFSNAKVPRMNATVVYGVGSGLWLTTKDYVDGVAIAGAPNASTSTKGIGRVSVAPVDATIPIFVGDNDTRVPTVNMAAFTAGYLLALAGDLGTPSGSNFYMTQLGFQKNLERYAVDTSASSTAYIVTLAPAPAALYDGMVVNAKIVTANTTTTPTLNLNALGAKTIVKLNNVALAVGDIGANMFCTFVYDATNTVWVLQNPIVSTFAVTTGSSSIVTTVGSTGTTTVTHSLGVRPKSIKFYFAGLTSSGYGEALMNPAGTVLSQDCSGTYKASDGYAGHPAPFVSTTVMYTNQFGFASVAISISAVTTTQFTVSSPAGANDTVNFVWVASN